MADQPEMKALHLLCYTDKILMLSGIGPKKQLEELGIQCLEDLPVGENLMNHVAVQVKATVKEGSGAITPEFAGQENNRMQYDSKKQGFLSSNLIEVVGFIQTGTEKGVKWPEIELQFLPSLYLMGADEPDIMHLKSKEFYPYMGYDKPREERMRQEGVIFLPTLSKPKSRGDVRLQSTDPLDPPIIDFHYLEDPYDVKVMIEAIRFVKKLTETEAFKHYDMDMFDLKMPGCREEADAFSDENLEDYIRHFTMTMFHQCGTCKMGSTNDPSSVVDPKLRVKGIRGLRVIDNSIMPQIISGNTNATAIMIGEKGADMIRSDSLELNEK